MEIEVDIKTHRLDNSSRNRVDRGTVMNSLSTETVRFGDVCERHIEELLGCFKCYQI